MDNSFVTSYGIACVRRNRDLNCYEILMIRKRHTYAFIEFVRGIYDPYKDADIRYMFENMTITEKSLVQMRDFETLWNYCNGKPTRASDLSMYNRANRKYEILIGREKDIITKLMLNTPNTNLLWEIPKGRPNRKETNLLSAVREFKEETGLDKEAYRILFDEGTIEYSFTDCGIKYKYIYYIAVMDSETAPMYDYRNEHMMREVSEIKFMSSVAIREFNEGRLAKLAKIIIKKAKRYM